MVDGIALPCILGCLLCLQRLPFVTLIAKDKVKIRIELIAEWHTKQDVLFFYNMIYKNIFFRLVIMCLLWSSNQIIFLFSKLSALASFGNVHKSLKIQSGITKQQVEHEHFILHWSHIVRGSQWRRVVVVTFNRHHNKNATFQGMFRWNVRAVLRSLEEQRLFKSNIDRKQTRRRLSICRCHQSLVEDDNRCWRKSTCKSWTLPFSHLLDLQLAGCAIIKKKLFVLVRNPYIAPYLTWIISKNTFT